MVSQARPQRARGFTLTELVVALAVAAILTGIAAPSFKTLVAGTRAHGAASDLYASAMRARSEAIKRNKEVSLKPATTGWQDGWSILDPQNDGQKLDDHPAVKGATITGPASVAFQPNGRVKGWDGTPFDISVSGNDKHRCVRIGLSGLPSQTEGGC
jgi:type IV fimbrial biogenesis protein FimT